MQLHDFDIYSIVLPVPLKILSLHLRNIICTAQNLLHYNMSNFKKKLVLAQTTLHGLDTLLLYMFPTRVWVVLSLEEFLSCNTHL